jgi:pimeloyl-ACP methyl ester carboxylesterase
MNSAIWFDCNLESPMNDSRVAVLDHVAVGTGPGVVLIHGTGADAISNWAPLTHALSDRYSFVAPNLPGAGASPQSSEPLSLDGLADAVHLTATAVGIDRYHVVGHSLGAVVAATLAARQPQAVTSVFLHAGWLKTGAQEAFMFETWTQLLRADSVLLARHLVLTAMGPQLLDTLDRAGFAELSRGFTEMLDERIVPQIELGSRVDLRDVVHGITAPTLVVSSADDQIVPARHQRELAAAIPGARHEVVPGGHGLPFAAPDRFVSIITAFLDEQEADRS